MKLPPYMITPTRASRASSVSACGPRNMPIMASGAPIANARAAGRGSSPIPSVTAPNSADVIQNASCMKKP